MSEYQFVAGLIPFYRQVEMSVLAGTGLVLSGVLAAIAALEAADKSRRLTEGLLLAAAAWVPTLLLLVEITALSRLRRASLYIQKCLYPLAERLTGESQVLRWEFEPTVNLIKNLPTHWPHSQRMWQSTIKLMVSSTPLIAIIWLATVGFAVAGVTLRTDSITIPLASGAGLTSTLLAGYGIQFTRAHESRQAGDSAALTTTRNLAGDDIPTDHENVEPPLR